MASWKHLSLAFALAAGVRAQSSSEKVWAVVAFINHGETTPFAVPILTPEGAQQMLRQGTAFRARYLGNVTDSDYDGIETAYIDDMNNALIDNILLDVTSQTDQHVSAGAMAFFQGLYPPSSDALENDVDDIDMARDYSQGSDNLTDYPLNGYQYPNIRTLSILDPMSIGIQGNLRCDDWESEMTNNLIQDQTMLEFYNATYSFYQLLFSTSPLEGTVDLADANLWNAYEIYEYVSYMFIHNETVYDGLANATSILSTLESYATSMERTKNTYGNEDDSAESEAKEVLYSIAGRTLANRVQQQFVSNLKWSGTRDKLSLMFGSFEPILSFISLSGLLTRETIESGPFSKLPEPGAAIVFELFSDNQDDQDEQPSYSDLSVRFYYRASADSDDNFRPHSLFGSENANNSIPYSDFVSEMKKLGKTANEWCDICGTSSASWCYSSYVTIGDSDSTMGHLDPIVAGVVGAVIMAVILALIAAALFFLVGLRLRRNVVKEEEPSNPAGGFKSPETIVGDKDVAVTREGFHHERVGSWELRDGSHMPSFDTAGIAKNDEPRERRMSLDDDDISVMGATPVKAHESV
ncbi:hypothetical protein AK830_g3222 [Neonectria ditissima]|uniref:Phosphoglycerate mutase-like protein n=1 Tax=Neonectria ditissima TaxID=78410 RepID=A0A0P7B9G2_9HYPO|nr:hypothetical protein AK830_g3222 [Neonectria ditissima]